MSITDEQVKKVDALKEDTSDIEPYKEEQMAKDISPAVGAIKEEHKEPEKEKVTTKEGEMEIKVKDELKRMDDDFDLKAKDEVKDADELADSDISDISPIKTANKEIDLVHATDIKPVKYEMEKEVKKDDMPIIEPTKDEKKKETEPSDIKVIIDEKEMEKINAAGAMFFTDEQREDEKEIGDIPVAKEEDMISKGDASSVTIKEEKEKEVCKDAVSTIMREEEIPAAKLATEQEKDKETSKDDSSDTKLSKEQEKDTTTSKDDASVFKPTIEDTSKYDTAAIKLTTAEEKVKLPSTDDTSAAKATLAEDSKNDPFATKCTKIEAEHAQLNKDDDLCAAPSEAEEETRKDSVKSAVEDEKEKGSDVVKTAKIEEEDVLMSKDIFAVKTSKDEFYTIPTMQEEKQKEMSKDICAIKSTMEEETEKAVDKEKTLAEEGLSIQDRSVAITPNQEETYTVIIKDEHFAIQPIKEEEIKDTSGVKTPSDEEKVEMKDVTSDGKLIKEAAKEIPKDDIPDTEVQVKEKEKSSDVVSIHELKDDIHDKEVQLNEKEMEKEKSSDFVSIHELKDDTSVKDMRDDGGSDESDLSDKQIKTQEVKEQEKADTSDRKPILDVIKDKETEKDDTKKEKETDSGVEQPKDTKEKESSKVETVEDRGKPQGKDDHPFDTESKKDDKKEVDPPMSQTLEEEEVEMDGVCYICEHYPHEETSDERTDTPNEKETAGAAEIQRGPSVTSSGEDLKPVTEDICLSPGQDKEAKAAVGQEEKMEKEKDDAHVAELSKEQKMEKEPEKEYTYETYDAKDDKMVKGKDVADEKTEEMAEKDSDGDHAREEKWEREELQEKDSDKTMKQPSVKASGEAAAASKSDSKPAFAVRSSDEEEEEEEEDICMGGAGSRPLSVEPRKSEHDISSQMPSGQTEPPTSEQTTVIIPTFTMQEPSIDEDVKDFGVGESRMDKDKDAAPLAKPEASFDSVMSKETTSVPKQEKALDTPAARAEPVADSTEPKSASSTVSSADGHLWGSTSASQAGVEATPQQEKPIPSPTSSAVIATGKAQLDEKPGKEAEREMEGEREMASPGLSQPCSYFMLDSEDAGLTRVVDAAPMPSEKEAVSGRIGDEKQTVGASKYDPYEKPIPKDRDSDSREESEVSLGFDRPSDIGFDDNRRTSQAEAGGGATFAPDDQYKEEPLSFSRVDYSPVSLTESERSSHHSASPQYEDREKGQEEEREREERPDTPYVERSFSSVDMQDNKMSQAAESYSFSPKEDKPEKSEKEKDGAASFQAGATGENDMVSARSAGASLRQDAASPSWGQSDLGTQASSAPDAFGGFGEKRTPEKEREKSAESFKDKMESSEHEREGSPSEAEDSNKQSQLPESSLLKVCKPTPGGASAADKQDASKGPTSPDAKPLEKDDPATSKLSEARSEDGGKTTTSPESSVHRMDGFGFALSDAPKPPVTNKAEDTDKHHLFPEPTTKRRLSSAEDLTSYEVLQSPKGGEDKVSPSASFLKTETPQPTSASSLTGSFLPPDRSESIPMTTSSPSPPLRGSYADIGQGRSGSYSEPFYSENSLVGLKEDASQLSKPSDDKYYSQGNIREEGQDISTTHEETATSPCTYTTLTYSTSTYSSTSYSYSSSPSTSAPLSKPQGDKVKTFPTLSSPTVPLAKEDQESPSSCFGGFQRDEYMEVTTKPAAKASLPSQMEETKPSYPGSSNTAKQTEDQTGSGKPETETKPSPDCFYMLETKITTSSAAPSLQSIEPVKVSEKVPEACFDVSLLQRAHSSDKESSESSEDEEPVTLEMEDSTPPSRIECQPIKVAEQKESFSLITESYVVESTAVTIPPTAVSKLDAVMETTTQTASLKSLSDSGASKTTCATADASKTEIKEKTPEVKEEKRAITPSKEDEKTLTAEDCAVEQKIEDKLPVETLCKDSAKERKETEDPKMCEKSEDGKKGGAEKVETKSFLEMPPERLAARRRSSISDWELLQKPEDCPSAPPPGYGDDDEEEEEEEVMEWMTSAHGTSMSSSKDTHPTETSGKGAARADRPSDLNTGAASSSSSASYPGHCEYKHRKGELSPSFINPSPHPLSSDEAEGEGDDRSDRSQDGDEDDQEQHSVKRRSHKQERHHAQSSHGDAGQGTQPLPGPGSSGLTATLAGEETPPTSVSESLPSQSDSDVPPGTEECPSITAEGNLDSDEDAEHLPVDKLSGAGGGHHPPSPRSAQKTHDPPPTPMKDPHPHPPHPDVCMVDPEALLNDHSGTEKLLKKEHKTTKGLRKGKPKSASPARKGEVRKRSSTPVKQTSKDSASPRSASLKRKDTDRSSRPSKTSETHGSKSEINNPGKGSVTGVKSSPGHNSQKPPPAAPSGPPIYVDLAYVPNHCSAKNVDQEFFKRVRAAYYVVTGNDPGSGEPSRGVLDALLEGKAQWGSNLQVCTSIREPSGAPTYRYAPPSGSPVGLQPTGRAGATTSLLPPSFSRCPSREASAAALDP
ncbi:Microtubule-associated protein 1B [Liparis tanakae]|uniref:Microtubule-associated protein 1B n=1 Tax=Liparis tanakae TaxID=230148 RepID=A0A4Z2IPS0_9TELE|nr:Microtubule-associated protein 1B [Liparis tanakae]